mmetsp:Transcript_26021/g.36473  ORF Transcript_26021/g.36473 Transcript_26021/m.36473 type:complete len:283 (-) Transcript_26021:1500-2348(-)
MNATNKTFPGEETRNCGERKNSPKHNFAHVAHGQKHSLAIDNDGGVYSWGINNTFGQLGRPTTKMKTSVPHSVTSFLPVNARAVRGFVGGLSDSGHSAILDSNGNLWVAGCDRWQQLGLGSSEGGASGYTWGDGGKIWRTEFTLNPYVNELLMKFRRKNYDKDEGGCTIRDVALGGDHTLVLASNQRDVVSFGKGSEGQLGLTSKPFVSAPVRSNQLSSSSADEQTNISMVCAVQHCSMTLDENGQLLKKAGKCYNKEDVVTNAIQECIKRGIKDGLMVDKE